MDLPKTKNPMTRFPSMMGHHGAKLPVDHKGHVKWIELLNLQP